MTSWAATFSVSVCETSSEPVRRGWPSVTGSDPSSVYDAGNTTSTAPFASANATLTCTGLVVCQTPQGPGVQVSITVGAELSSVIVTTPVSADPPVPL